MPKSLLVITALLFFASLSLKAQQPIEIKKDSAKIVRSGTDTLKPKPYVNLGKIAGRKAALRSAMVPGLGQIGNGVTVYRLIKVGAIYTGATLLALSYIDNTNNYHKYLTELQYRVNHNGVPDPNGSLIPYPTSGLITAKDTYARNRWVIIFSFGALYAANIIEAYVDARLKYFDIGQDLGFKISPTLIQKDMLYGYNGAVSPGIKLSMRF
ncbi:DUF5683 domain-containing protein [Pedobacter nutrimenti]|uniref:DUF5683 domain-containing protein n=1 Tax=Pedobacter nutrimenti TaxID=1241337 RepID=A0A318UDI6_9SPHI|nr:DUF5683 domain-containing protein [Pedobacter nutrimenti]PYF74482.1 hypothetical protein B0O44_104654 [Pedobacter nutrimenti]